MKKLTAKQNELIEALKASGEIHIDADGRGVSHFAGKTVNGNLISALVSAGRLTVGNQPGSTRWRYTLVN